MLALNETTKTFEIILGAVPATEGEWTTSYLEGAMDSGVPSTFDAKIDSGVSNGTTAVTVLSAPPANARRVLKSFCYYSVVASTFTFRLNPSGGVFRRVVFVLDAGDIVTYEDSEGWRVLDSTGGFKTDTGVSFPLLAPAYGAGAVGVPSYSFDNAPTSGLGSNAGGSGGILVLKGTDPVGTDLQGGRVDIDGGLGTGLATGGGLGASSLIRLRISPASTTGSTPNPLQPASVS